MKISQLNLPTDCRVLSGDKQLLISSASYSQDKGVLVLQRPFLIGRPRLQTMLRDMEPEIILAMRGGSISQQYAVRIRVDPVGSTDGLHIAPGGPPLDVVNLSVVSATPCTVPDSVWTDEDMIF
jgi:hypothetical protein